jgi:uncharacterized protein
MCCGRSSAPVPTVNAKTADTAMAVLMASVLGHLEVVQALLDAKADPNVRAFNGGTALMAASGKGY